MRRFLILAFFLVGASSLCAHPDVFIKVDLRLSPPHSLEFVWTFDRLFSRMIIEHCDTDRDGEFDEMEAWQMYNKVFDGSPQVSQLMTSVWFDNRRAPDLTLKDYALDTPDGEQVRFIFTLVSPSVTNWSSCKIAQHDRTRYYAFFSDQDPVKAPPGMVTATDGHGRLQIWQGSAAGMQRVDLGDAFPDIERSQGSSSLLYLGCLLILLLLVFWLCRRWSAKNSRVFSACHLFKSSEDAKGI